MRHALLFATMLAPVLAMASPAEEAADAFCQCNQASFRLMEETMDAFFNGDTSLMVEKSEELEASSAANQACNAALREKYAGRGEVFATEMAARIERWCPHPQWSGGMPSMGGMGLAAGGRDPLGAFMRAMGAPPK